MNVEEYRLEEYGNCIADIAIAERYIQDSMLYPNGIIADFYCIPSGNRHAYYAILCHDAGRVKLVWAKNTICEYMDDVSIYEYTFASCVEAMGHPPKSGQIIVGTSAVSDMFYSEILSVLNATPEKYVFEDFDGEHFVLDGITAGIRRYANGKIEKELFFHELDAVTIADASYRETLDHIITGIGKLVENTAETQKMEYALSVNACENCVRKANKQSPTKCPKCKKMMLTADCQGPSYVLHCNNCGWQIVGASFWAPCEIDRKSYTVTFDHVDKKVYVKLAKELGINVIELHNLLSGSGTCSETGAIMRAFHLIMFAKENGIGYTVSPDPFDEYPEFADCPLRI